jgi:hypothetical protein
MTDDLPSDPSTPAPSIQPPTTPAIPAAWYPDPSTGQQRYWDGTKWTEHYAPPAAVAPPRKGGAAPIVLGIIGLVLAFIPGALYVGIVLGIIALVLGILASRAKNGGRGGLVLGIVAIVVASLFAGVYGAASTPSEDASDSSALIAPKMAPKAAATPAPSATPKATPSPAQSVEPKPLTFSQEQAVISAQGYLSEEQGFSYQGLLQQLTSKYGEGFPKKDAVIAIKSLHVNWNQQAVYCAKSYLSDGMGFSHNSLLQQLTSKYGSGFTKNQAEYALKKVHL